MSARPQGANASPGRWWRGDGLAVHLLRTAGLTLASGLVAAALVVAALRVAAADHPDPWDVILVEADGVLAEAAPIVVGALTAWATLGAAVLVLVLLCTIGLRVRRWLRPRPERTTGGERP